MTLSRFYLVPIAFFLFFSGMINCWASTPEPKVQAAAAIIMEVDTGQVLWEKESRQIRQPASTTKVLTGILSVELGRWDEDVKVSRRAAYAGGANIYLQPGENMILGELVKGALIRSGNDAATALAEHIGGSEAAFAFLMNRKAKVLGAEQSSFQNPHGLPNKKHLTTAYDLAVITRYALSNPLFSWVVRQREAVIKGVNGQGVRRLGTTNRLLGSYPGVDGVKTGTTNAAGQCLITSATRGGRRLITVVLGSHDRYGDTIKLLEYGFAAYEHEAIPMGSAWSTVYLPGGKQLELPLVALYGTGVSVPRNQAADIERRVILREGIDAPVERGEVLGRLEILNGDRVVENVPLVAPYRVERRLPFSPPLPSKAGFRVSKENG